MKKISLLVLVLCVGILCSDAAGQRRRVRTKIKPAVQKPIDLVCAKPPAATEFVISSRKVRNVAILDLSGSVTDECDGVILQNLVTNLVNKSEKKIILNMDGIELEAGQDRKITENFTLSLVNSFTIADRLNGRVKMLNLTATIKDLLFITKILTVFDVFDTEKEAIASFN